MHTVVFKQYSYVVIFLYNQSVCQLDNLKSYGRNLSVVSSLLKIFIIKGKKIFHFDQILFLKGTTRVRGFTLPDFLPIIKAILFLLTRLRDFLSPANHPLSVWYHDTLLTDLFNVDANLSLPC